MIRQVLTALCVVLALAGAAQAADRAVARGRYLVEGVGMCGDCHTPRGPTGEPIADQALMGAPIGFKPLVDMPWRRARLASPVAGGLHGRAARDLSHDGADGGRQAAASAHAPYRFNKADARAVTAYLKSLR